MGRSPAHGTPQQFRCASGTNSISVQALAGCFGPHPGCRPSLNRRHVDVKVTDEAAGGADGEPSVAVGLIVLVITLPQGSAVPGAIANVEEPLEIVTTDILQAFAVRETWSTGGAEPFAPPRVEMRRRVLAPSSHNLVATVDRLESMRVLLKVVEAGSLSAGSRRLGMPLATVSRKVSDLEAHIKTRLLNRSSRTLTLTGAGQSYVAACRRILEDVDEAERAASGEYSAPKGDLVITAPVEFGRLHVLPITTEFLKAYPEINIRIVMADRLFNLQEDRVDLAVRIGALPDSSLLARRVGQVRRVVTASPTYFAERGMPRSPEEVSSHDCITFEGLTSPGTWTFARGRLGISVPVRSRLVDNTAEASVDAAISGVGITRVLSYQIADAVAGGKLVLALEAFEPPPWPISLVHAGQGLLPLKTRAFLDFATAQLRAKLVP